MPRANSVKIEVGLPAAVRDALQKKADEEGMELSGYVQTLIQQASGITWDIARLYKGESKKKAKLDQD